METVRIKPEENLGQSTSLWMATTAAQNRSALTQDAHADVCIVGAGIAGITTAYLLAKQGKSVVVLDDGAVGGGQTQRTTAHLSNALDDRYFEIERLHGSEGARLAANSHTAAIDRIESIIGEEQIACDFVRLDGYLFLPPGESAELLDRELAAAHRAGLGDVERLPHAPLASFDTGPCLRFPCQAQFHPTMYLNALASAIERAGGRIFSGTHAETIKGGRPARIEASNGRTVTADAVVVATNSPVNDLVAIHTKQAAYMSYAIGAIVPRGAVATALYWDTLDPYHYVRIQPFSSDADMPEANSLERQDVLIVGGEDHKTGQAPAHSDPYARLEAWTRVRFPMIREVRFRWSGEVMETIDGLAFIGRNPLDHPNVFIVTGDSGMGMTHGAIAGILLTDLILGRENPWAALYDPSRKTLGALHRFVKENLNLAVQYGDWLTSGDVDSPAQIKPGEGAVIRHGLMKTAVYRDEQGDCHECSAICPHLGGIVHWNDAEKTWDCPCHGSRFDRLGGVLGGPANRDLGAVDSDPSRDAKATVRQQRSTAAASQESHVNSPVEDVPSFYQTK
jgi:glycine/D-amino acid oxidase-like deaminating enzyme/nitrite reductase/ring-hydroxylating ferredoxin subunit